MRIKFDNINKYFGEAHILKNINFEVSSGQIFGYLGRNGAGKTTSLRVLMDVFKADSGKVLLDGKSFDRSQYRIGYLPEERGMYSKSIIKDQLVYFAMLRGASRKEAVETVEKWAKRFEIDQYLNKKLETLSKGNQQKVQITQAFLGDPDILILDEPFSGLDPVNSQVFQDALKEYIADDKIIIFSSHQMGYVETFCDDIAIINYGEIVLKGNLSLIKKELGNRKIRLEIERSPEDWVPLIEHLVSIDLNDYNGVFKLKEGVTKSMVLQELLNHDIEIVSFSDYEPSLHDIFLSHVGGTR